MPSELEALERGLPTTSEDVAALRAQRRASYMTATEIAAAVARLGERLLQDPRDRPITRGEAFRLSGSSSEAGVRPNPSE